MTTADLIAYYQNLLIIQFAREPKARATVAAVVAAALGDQITAKVGEAFDLENAVGAQLDKLGNYIGQTRYLYGFDPGKTFFAMPSYSDPDPDSYLGFAIYSDTTVVATFLSYQDDIVITGVLIDEEYRPLLQYLARKNAAETGNGPADDLLQSFFPDVLTLTDNGNMTITYTHDSADTNKLFATVAYLGALPKPAGVGYNIVET